MTVWLEDKVSSMIVKVGPHTYLSILFSIKFLVFW